MPGEEQTRPPTLSQPSSREFPGSCYVILHIAMGPREINETKSDDLVVRNGERFELRDDIWIERLDEQTAKNVQEACEPPNYQIKKSIWDRHLYAFVMKVPTVEDRRYGGLDLLHSVIALSRLINPTSTGNRCCAQIMHFGMKDSAILAVEYRGASLDVTLGPVSRDWLTRAEGEILRKLMPWVSNKEMRKRVHRAYFNHEYAMRSHYLDIRWMFVVEGLDALINTGSNNQHFFRTRLKKIADYLQMPISQDELSTAYEVRSKLVHTEHFLWGLDQLLPRTEHDALYEKLEQILRATVLTALLDDRFANSFEDEASVKSRWGN
jgi:hypothetical protein